MEGIGESRGEGREEEFIFSTFAIYFINSSLQGVSNLDSVHNVLKCYSLWQDTTQYFFALSSKAV